MHATPPHTHPGWLIRLACVRGMCDTAAAQLLGCLTSLSKDHSVPWEARLAATDLLAGVVAAGGPGALAAIGAGAFGAFVDLLERDTFPFYTQAGSWRLSVGSLCVAVRCRLVYGVGAATARRGRGGRGGRGPGAAIGDDLRLHEWCRAGAPLPRRRAPVHMLVPAEWRYA